MSSARPVPRASWWCAAAGAPTPVRLAAEQRRTWRYDDFGDRAVSRHGASLWVLGSAWSVTNHSTTMQNVHLYDVRYGRRLLGPLASLPLLRSPSWLLLPSSAGDDHPYVVSMALEVNRDGGPPSGEFSTRPPVNTRATISPGEPSGSALIQGLERARGALTDPDLRDLLATFARPYFAVSTAPVLPASRRQVATCLPGAEDRGERAMYRMREAIWGRADRQGADVVLRLLIRHGLLTHRDVCAVRHDPRCGHHPRELDPAAHARSGETGRALRQPGP